MRTASSPDSSKRGKSLHAVSGWIAVLLLLVQLVSGGDSPTQQAFELFRAALPQLRAAHPDNYDTPEKLQAAWKRFHESLAVAKTARAMGYAERPEIVYRIEQLLAQELILRDAETARPVYAITEADIDAHLASNRERFESPAQLSVHEFVVVFDGRNEGAREANLERAQQVRSSFSGSVVPLDQFLAAVRAHSDPDYIRTNGGFLGVFSVCAVTNASSPMVPAAAYELLASRKPGTLSRVHEFGDSFRIYRLGGYRDAVLGNSAAVRDGVRRALYLQARDKRIKELASRSGMDLNAELNKQQIDLLEAAAATSQIQTADLPPSPAGADIPLPEPLPANVQKKP